MDNLRISVLQEQLELMITVPNPQNVGAWLSAVKNVRNRLFNLLDEIEITWEEGNCEEYADQRTLKGEVNLQLKQWESILDARIPKVLPRSIIATQKPFRALPRVTLPDNEEAIEAALLDAQFAIWHACSADSMTNILDAMGQYCALLLMMSEEALQALIDYRKYNRYVIDHRLDAKRVSQSITQDDWIVFAQGISRRDLHCFYPR